MNKKEIEKQKLRAEVFRQAERDRGITPKRKCKYINHLGNEVWLDEEQAAHRHNALLQRGGKYLGDQHGDMTPPNAKPYERVSISGFGPPRFKNAEQGQLSGEIEQLKKEIDALRRQKRV